MEKCPWNHDIFSRREKPKILHPTTSTPGIGFREETAVFGPWQRPWNLTASQLVHVGGCWQGACQALRGL